MALAALIGLERLLVSLRAPFRVGVKKIRLVQDRLGLVKDRFRVGLKQV